MSPISLDDFYKDNAALIPEGISKEIGHFNVFDVNELIAAHRKQGLHRMSYNRRAYYKINLISGRNRAEYADKVIEIEKNGLLFGSPKIPYHWLPQDDKQGGYFCLFTEEFLIPAKSGVLLDELPIFRPGGYPVFQLSDGETEEITYIFKKMQKELASDYAYKYDLLRNYVLELIHYGQKLQPHSVLHPTHSASALICSLFIELLERQFPIESPRQKVALRAATDYANRLAVHVNHLNKVLKENTGKITTGFINERMLRNPKFC